LAVGYRGYHTKRESAADLQAVWAKGEEALKAGRYADVESALRRLERSREPTPLDWFLRAQLALGRNQPDRGLAALAQVPDDHVMAAQARFLAGHVELKRDRAKSAEAFYRAALKLDPSLISARRELIYIFGMQLRRAELDTAFLALSEQTDLTGENVFHWCLLRTISWEPGESVAVLSRYVAADPTDRWSRIALASNYRRMGLHKEADSTLSSLPQDDPDALEIRAQIALDHQDEAEAERLLSLGPPDYPELARLRGRLALAKGDARSALHHFRLANAADPENHETIFGLLSALQSTGDEASARPLRELARDLERLNTLIQQAATAQARKNPVLLRQLGAACAALHRDAEARAWYTLALRSDPLDPEAQRALFRLRDPSRPPRSSRTLAPAR
jgi:tetratricopeptide (TPR) repeat protein